MTAEGLLLFEEEAGRENVTLIVEGVDMFFLL